MSMTDLKAFELIPSMGAMKLPAAPALMEEGSCSAAILARQGHVNALT
jgi:hypothetical protein